MDRVPFVYPLLSMQQRENDINFSAVAAATVAADL